MVLDVEVRVFSLFTLQLSFYTLHLVAKLGVGLEQFSNCVDAMDQALSLGILLLLVKKSLTCCIQAQLRVVRAVVAEHNLQRFIWSVYLALDARQDHLPVQITL